MNAHTNLTAHRDGILCEQLSARKATVKFDKTWFAIPHDWSLRIAGPSVGGYGVINDLNRSIPTGRYTTREAAERVAAIWIETGLIPCFQTADRIAAIRACLAKITPPVSVGGA